MLTRQMVEQLEATARPGVNVLSVYLDVDPTTGLWRDKTYDLERALDQLSESLPKPERTAFANDRAQVAAYLADYKSHAKGLVMFAGVSQGLWWTRELHVPVHNETRYDKGPFLSPLASLLDEYQSACVALVDDRSARLFVVGMGEVEEQEKVRSEVDNRHSQTEHTPRIEQQHGAMRQRHLKDVAEVIEQLHRQATFRRLIIGGAVEALAHFERELPPDIAPLVVGRFTAPMYANDQDILREAMKAEAAYEQAKESATVAELITRAAKNQMAVLGADQTLAALKQRQVFELVAAGGLKVQGFQCPGCGLLAGTYALPCPQCGATMLPIEDVVEKAVEQAVAAGARVEVVNGPARERLVQAGGLGALLAYGKT